MSGRQIDLTILRAASSPSNNVFSLARSLSFTALCTRTVEEEGRLGEVLRRLPLRLKVEALETRRRSCDKSGSDWSECVRCECVGGLFTGSVEVGRGLAVRVAAEVFANA